MQTLTGGGSPSALPTSNCWRTSCGVNETERHSTSSWGWHIYLSCISPTDCMCMYRSLSFPLTYYLKVWDHFPTIALRLCGAQTSKTMSRLGNKGSFGGLPITVQVIFPFSCNEILRPITLSCQIRQLRVTLFPMSRQS
ncbi:hypothetical protein FKM82_014423 [Ascaphus truei]